MSTIEEDNGVHSKEMYKPANGKSTSERYGEHIKIDETNAVANKEVIDCNKRGKVQDVTNSEFSESEPSMKE